MLIGLLMLLSGCTSNEVQELTIEEYIETNTKVVETTELYSYYDFDL
jgi:hypothetical protein